MTFLIRKFKHHYLFISLTKTKKRLRRHCCDLKMFLKWLSAVTQITSKIITKSSVHEEVWIMPLFGVVIDWCESNFLIFQCYASTNTNNLLSAIVCNFRAFVGHFISSIWLRFGIKSSFRVLITKWILKSSSYFCLAKKQESALAIGLPILARQYDGSKVIF